MHVRYRAIFVCFFFPYLTYSFVWSSRMPSEKICVQTKPSVLSITAIFPWPWKTVSVSVCYLFYQPVDGKIKAWTLRFLAKEKPNMEEALFDWPIVLQYDVKAKYRLISRKFSGIWLWNFFTESSLNQPKAKRLCSRSINQSNRSISVCLLFLFSGFARFQGHMKIAL